MLVHQVYFWLKEPNSTEDQAALKRGLQKLLTIKTIKSGHIGVPASTPARDVVDHSFSFAYFTSFESLEDHESYQVDPVHLQFVEECAHLWSKVQVYDYEQV